MWWGSNDYMTRNIFTSGQTYWCNFFSPISDPNLVADTIAKHVRLIDSNLVSSGAGSVSTEAGSVTWTRWHSAGLDMHSAAGDPMFVDVNQTWPGYGPKGNYQVKPGSPALNIGFKNFAMDSFGVMSVATATVQAPFPGRLMENGAAHMSDKVRYASGMVMISLAGNYRVTVTTAQGRIVAAFSGKGISNFAVTKKMAGSGLYLLTVNSAQGIFTRKLLIH